MKLRTYTGLWQVEKRIYKFYDINLPYPVTVKQIGLFFGSLIPWMILMAVIGVPFAPPFGHVIWLAPPIGIAWFANQPVAEGKNLVEYAASQVLYFLGHRLYAALSPVGKNEAHHRVHGTAWARREALQEHASESASSSGGDK